MPDSPQTTPDIAADNRRREPRLELSGEVTLELPSGLQGAGTNISSQGVLITLDEAVAVQVRLPGREEPVQGRLIRVQDLGDGRQGLAVRFDGIIDPEG